MEQEKKERTSIQVADIFGTIFRPGKGAYSEILDTVSNYSLQLTPRQQRALLRLEIFSHSKNIPETERQKILIMIDRYKELKRYHDTLPPVVATVKALSLMEYWGKDSMKSQVLKNQQQ